MRMICFVALFSLGLATTTVRAQTGYETTDEILQASDLIKHNMDVAIQAHQLEDSNFRPSKQQPEIKRDLPPLLVTKNDFFQDWTRGQHARYLMEAFRQGLHVLLSAEKPRGLDSGVIPAVRDYWPKLRDISCKDAPGTQYFDLDGISHYCPQ